MVQTLCVAQERLPILYLRPSLEVVEDDIGELTAERGEIHCITDAAEPFAHLGTVFTHSLPDDIERDLGIPEGAASDTREAGNHIVASELVACKIEARTHESAFVLKDASSNLPDVRDCYLREFPRCRERSGVDALTELLCHEIKVLHKVNRCD